ncbi:carbohydrate ABC transporter permease [Jeotgalibaca sp. MA1X17-3]|uniref:carbohydrate ABC transporter permease n=1 Tax=Jeotgalibaca sp. MA1X17-3 TaxID=2908211 RepID=UPI001F270C2E|nr:carbohydrate ABC transporter permease [Jeotgalibaca sp. MA1X17-3]UJF15859.1 carbohydrate ABC transporter permease [Jeotgalibaca sp. MA1X17-3]
MENIENEKIINRKKNKVKNTKKKGFSDKTLIHIILIFGAVLTILPFIWMILTAFKTVSESMAIPPKIFPQKWELSNFIEAFNTLPFKNLYINTLSFTVAATIGQVIFCSMAGYVFARIDFWGRDFLFLLVLSVLMVPSQIFIIPQFQIITALKLSNTIRALILPNLFSAFGTFLMRQYFIAIPDEIEEAAIIDGANHFTIFFKVMLPLVKPGIVSLVISTSLFTWNTLLWPLIVNTSKKSMTLSAGLASLQDIHTTNYPVLMAAALLAIWPMVVIFIIFQRQFIEGIANRGGK